LWNPCREPASQHFLELDDGTFYPLTATGAFTLRRLRLNRLPLVAHRQRKRLLTRYRDLVKVLEQLLTQQSILMEEQQRLLKEQRQLLQLLLGSGK
jgi:hypothetical protein